MRRHYPEQSLHLAVAKYLALVLRPCTFWTSLDHAGGGVTVGHFRKRRGVKRGIPDVMILDNGFGYFIELKAEGGRVTPEQIQCHETIRAAHGKVTVCRSVNDVAETLAQWGIRTRDVSSRQPSAKAA